MNRLPGDTTVGPKAIDSRSAAHGSVPDLELHATTVAAVIAAAKPVMVVVSTPVYCISRFCGPITDSVQRLARRYRDRMAFVHAEVWNGAPAPRKINREAAEWIYRGGSRGNRGCSWWIARERSHSGGTTVATDAEPDGDQGDGRRP